MATTGLLAVRAALDACYVYCVVPAFGYEGFKLEPHLMRYVASWALYLLAIAVTPLRLRKPSDLAFTFATTTIIAPLDSMYGLSGESIVPVVTSLFSMLLMYGILNASFIRVVRMPYFRFGERLAILASTAVVLIVALHYVATGVHWNFNLGKVYDFRSENNQLSADGIFGYLNSWAYQVFNLFLIAVFLRRKRYVVVLGLLLVQVIFFAASQQKATLFAPLVIICVWFYMKRYSNLTAVPFGVAFYLVGALMIYRIYGYIMLSSLAIRRIFFVPAHLSFVYFDFFSRHPKVYWGDSFWMPFVHSPYAVRIPYVIGDFLGSQALGANNGYVSSGFAQAGFLGVFLYSIVFAYAMKIVDVESKWMRSVWLGAGLFLLPIMTIWRSSDLSTSFLTHGFLVMLMLFGLLRRPPASETQKSATRSARDNVEVGKTFEIARGINQ